MIPKPVSLYAWSFPELLTHISDPLFNFVLIIKNSNVTGKSTFISGKAEDWLWQNPLVFMRTWFPLSGPQHVLHRLQDKAKLFAVTLETPSPTSPSPAPLLDSQSPRHVKLPRPRQPILHVFSPQLMLSNLQIFLSSPQAPGRVGCHCFWATGSLGTHLSEQVSHWVALSLCVCPFF